MSSRANVAYELDDQIGTHEASVNSVSFQIIAKCDEGVILAWAAASAVAGVSACRVAAGSPAIAPGAHVIMTITGTTQPLVINTGATGSVAWSLASVVFGG